MSQTFDVIVVGEPDDALLRLASGHLRQGRRVLVVLGICDRGAVHKLRRRLLTDTNGGVRLTVTGNAEVVCVAGAEHPEAVVIRRKGTNGLLAVNTAAVLTSAPSDLGPESAQGRRRSLIPLSVAGPGLRGRG